MYTQKQQQIRQKRKENAQNKNISNNIIKHARKKGGLKAFVCTYFNKN